LGSLGALAFDLELILWQLHAGYADSEEEAQYSLKPSLDRQLTFEGMSSG